MIILDTNKDKKSWIQEEVPGQVKVKEFLKDNVIYTHDDILNFIEKEYGTRKGFNLSKILKNLENLGDVMRVKTPDGVIIRSTQGLKTVTGKVEWQLKGHALVNIMDENSDFTGETIYLPKNEAARVLNGEIVEVKVIPASWRSSRGGDDEGLVVNVLHTSPCYTIGENVGTDRSGWIGAIKLCEPMFNKVIRISERHEDRGNEDFNENVKKKGNIIGGFLRRSGSFDRYGPLRAWFDAKSILGTWADYGIETKLALEWMRAEDKFSSVAMAEAYRITGITVSDLMKDKGRKDLRHIPFVTIDGAGTKDFDDALFARKDNNGNLKIFVAIADVSRYIEKDSVLDKVARKRMTSIYMSHKVIPMLPDILSTGVCSLIEGMERAAMVYEATLDVKNKSIVDTKFYHALMKSHGRLTYNDVDNFANEYELKLENIGPLKSNGNEIPEWDQSVINTLMDLYEGADLLRSMRNPLEFDRIPEIVPVIGQNGKAESLRVIDEMSPANKLVEEFMLLANREAAKFLYEKGSRSVLYRNQKPPSDGQTILKSAKYEMDNSGHYSLGHDHYTHFTSPIRRYVDLMSHRAMKKVLGISNDPEIEKDEMMEISSYSNQRVKSAKGASDKAKQWLILEYATHLRGIVDKVSILRDGERSWLVMGEKTKIIGYVNKPSSDEDKKFVEENGLYMEIDRSDVLGEKIYLKVSKNIPEPENNKDNDFKTKM